MRTGTKPLVLQLFYHYLAQDRRFRRCVPGEDGWPQGHDEAYIMVAVPRQG